jgi:hypothetical protein
MITAHVFLETIIVLLMQYECINHIDSIALVWVVWGWVVLWRYV